MHEKACEAYVSFVRSYASYPKEIREIFSFKALHLGHLAKSFALRDPPSKITGIGKGSLSFSMQPQSQGSMTTLIFQFKANGFISKN